MNVGFLVIGTVCFVCALITAGLGFTGLLSEENAQFNRSLCYITLTGAIFSFILYYLDRRP